MRVPLPKYQPNFGGKKKIKIQHFMTSCEQMTFNAERGRIFNIEAHFPNEKWTNMCECCWCYSESIHQTTCEFSTQNLRKYFTHLKWNKLSVIWRKIKAKNGERKVVGKWTKRNRENRETESLLIVKTMENWSEQMYKRTKREIKRTVVFSFSLPSRFWWNMMPASRISVWRARPNNCNVDQSECRELSTWPAF